MLIKSQYILHFLISRTFLLCLRGLLVVFHHLPVTHPCLFTVSCTIRAVHTVSSARTSFPKTHALLVIIAHFPLFLVPPFTIHHYFSSREREIFNLSHCPFSQYIIPFSTLGSPMGNSSLGVNPRDKPGGWRRPMKAHKKR